ncbi:MAG TPA: MraY family glycosyltransferase [Candidatus Peribacteria bacterium]|nr:MraY family glycosyltransferase [Candidatus Peribacteria bacterium]
MSPLFVLPAAALLLTFFGHLAALKVFPKLGLLDFPERYGHKRARLPYPTGIIASLTFAVLFAIAVPLHGVELGVLIGILSLAIMNLIDDRSPLPFRLRLSVQLVVCVLIFAAGTRIYTITNPFGGLLKLDTVDMPGGVFGPLPLFSGIFTVGWLLLTINAMNWFDGIPGQVSILSTIGFTMLGLLALLRNGQPEVAMIAFTLAAIALACCCFDFPPGKVLMGDSGSMFFGLMLGVLGVYQGGKVATAFLAIGIPLIDAAFVIVSRMLRGSSPFKGGRDHLHHLLLARGWSARSVVLFTAVISTAFGASALYMNTAQKGIAAVALLVVVTAVSVYAKRKTRT